MRRALAVMAALLVAFAAACTPQVATERARPKASPAATTVPSVAPSPSPPPVHRQLPPRFRGTISAIPSDLAAYMRGTTWRPGCPVPLSDLRLLTLRYWGFRGHVHEGPMVVNESVAEGVVSVFRRLFQARFAIKGIHLAHRYRGPGHDDPWDRRDFTASFNCRPAVTAYGPRDNWSQHAFGLAIDINPIQNPYVASDGFIHNFHARHYRDRSLSLPGMIHAGDVVVRAFEAIGWHWGGYWSGDKDYMHFSLTGG